MPINTKQTAEFPVPRAELMIETIIDATTVVVADIETTGFGGYDDITEIGAVKVDILTGKIIEKFSTFVHLKLQKKVPAKIADLTGICTEDLAKAPCIEDVLTSFLSFVGSLPIIFHNAPFDWRMLNTKYKLIGRTLTNPVICTKKIFSFLHPGLPAGLKEVTAYYGTPIEGHHRAYVDCKWTAACYRKMRDELIERAADQKFMADIIAYRTCLDVLTYEEIQKNCQIYRIQGWAKGKKNRIYCTTSLADIYYDLDFKVWDVASKKTTKQLNVNDLAQFVLAQTGLDLLSFIGRYQKII